jgi:hypothetical protein
MDQFRSGLGDAWAFSLAEVDITSSIRLLEEEFNV